MWVLQHPTLSRGSPISSSPRSPLLSCVFCTQLSGPEPASPSASTPSCRPWHTLVMPSNSRTTWRFIIRTLRVHVSCMCSGLKLGHSPVTCLVNLCCQGNTIRRWQDLISKALWEPLCLWSGASEGMDIANPGLCLLAYAP